MIDQPVDPAAYGPRLADPATRQQALTDLGEWVRQTCLFAGSQAFTAYIVAARFVQGIEALYPPTSSPFDWYTKPRKQRRKGSNYDIPADSPAYRPVD